MKNHITFRITAYTEAAGKYNEEAPNKGNEDNFFVDDNLADKIPQSFHTDKEIVLSDCGMLMAVADGMGGMNAGEVASEIAVNTVKEYFSPGKITPELAATHESRKRFIEDVIVEADKRIKADAKNNSEHEGMGSTIIVAWLSGDELTVSWCGDSRAYRFNAQNGLQPLSEDHSYVQELVNQGIITYDQAFDHPQGNIITRSLGDPSKKAKPETRLFKVYNSDIIMLCSDGLSGVLRDEEIETIIRNNCSTMQECREALWDAAEKAGWYDNVTTILCEILNGASETPEEFFNKEPEMVKQEKTYWNKTVNIRTSRKSLLAIIAVVFSLLVLGAVYLVWNNIRETPPPEDTDEIVQTNNKPTLEERKIDLTKRLKEIQDFLEIKAIVDDINLADSAKLDEIERNIQILEEKKKCIISIEKTDSINKKINEIIEVKASPAQTTIDPETGTEDIGPTHSENDLTPIKKEYKEVEYRVEKSEGFDSANRNIKKENPEYEIVSIKRNNEVINESSPLYPGDILVFSLKLIEK
ncbi:PP2C family serine/threonine-protein phosphatase [Bacteroides sp. 519]|uniref:PP2C family protein-serine/threonine phosphatase n=1 Tax=Bacteroides sp. 519 TaxID=2302937 RepID=UPI0013D2B9B4|nr:protein phosphatase 2C domain-containing protein [Bacteroides sp. 519]NDV57869.1 serine/threonine-protein phosphatase [Bacteroides sp. 519]